MIRVVQFSGGKDSTALVLWAREQWGDDFLAVYCDTAWEHPITMAYIDRIDATLLGGRLIRLKSEKYPGGMLPMLQDRQYIPSVRARFCTDELKIRPMAAFCRGLSDEFTVYQGVRADESKPRRDAGPRVWDDHYDAWIERPLFHWTAKDVFAMHAKHGIEPNPLYKLGSSRVGCFPCVLMRHKELKRVGTMLPELWDRIREMEAASGRSFFRPDYIPARFLTGVSEWGPYPTVEDVRKYLFTASDAQIDMFDDGKPITCMSVYNQCE